MTDPTTDRTPTPPGRPVGALPAALTTMLPPAHNAPPGPGCRHCGAPATTSWQRQATDDERDGYWNAMEANIRSQPNLFDDQNASYTADRTQPVTKAEFGCDEHQVPDLTLLHATDCGGHQACQCEGTTTDG